MRQFPQIADTLIYKDTDPIDSRVEQMKGINQAVADALGLKTCLKPEVSILLELYQAKRSHERLTVTMLGLLDAIAPTTTLRYLTMLEENGAVVRRAHEHDGRATYVEISDAAEAALDKAFQSQKINV